MQHCGVSRNVHFFHRQNAKLSKKLGYHHFKLVKQHALHLAYTVLCRIFDARYYVRTEFSLRIRRRFRFDNALLIKRNERKCKRGGANIKAETGVLRCLARLACARNGKDVPPLGQLNASVTHNGISAGKLAFSVHKHGAFTAYAPAAARLVYMRIRNIKQIGKKPFAFKFYCFFRFVLYDRKCRHKNSLDCNKKA